MNKKLITGIIVLLVLICGSLYYFFFRSAPKKVLHILSVGKICDATNKEDVKKEFLIDGVLRSTDTLPQVTATLSCDSKTISISGVVNQTITLGAESENLTLAYRNKKLDLSPLMGFSHDFNFDGYKDFFTLYSPRPDAKGDDIYLVWIYDKNTNQYILDGDVRDLAHYKWKNIQVVDEERQIIGTLKSRGELGFTYTEMGFGPDDSYMIYTLRALDKVGKEVLEFNPLATTSPVVKYEFTTKGLLDSDSSTELLSVDKNGLPIGAPLLAFMPEHPLFRFNAQIQYIKPYPAPEYFMVDNAPDELSDGMRRVVLNKKIGYMGKNYLVVIPPQFECAYPFENGKAKVALNCTQKVQEEHTEWTSDSWFYIDKQGKKILE